MLPYVSAPVTLTSAAAGLVGELAIGVLIGLGVSLVFIGVQIAGQLISQQAGLALGDVFDPAFESSTTVVSQVYFYAATVIFLAVGGDRAIVRAVLDSFRSIPPLTLQSPVSFAAVLVSLRDALVHDGYSRGRADDAGAAVVVSGVGLYFADGPQLNLFSVGFPIKLALALAIMAMTFMSLEPVLLDGVHTCMDAVARALRLA